MYLRLLCLPSTMRRPLRKHILNSPNPATVLLQLGKEDGITWTPLGLASHLLPQAICQATQLLPQAGLGEGTRERCQGGGVQDGASVHRWEF